MVQGLRANQGIFHVSCSTIVVSYVCNHIFHKKRLAQVPTMTPILGLLSCLSTAEPASTCRASAQLKDTEWRGQALFATFSAFSTTTFLCVLKEGSFMREDLLTGQ